mgnify:FL=1
MSEQSIEFAASLLQDNGAGTEFSQQEWLKERQQEARAQLKMYPLPTTAEEEWRFTDLTALYKSTLSVPRVDVSVDPSVINSLLIPEAVSSIVLVDGVYSSEMSVVDEGKAKIKVSNLKAALQDKSLTSILKDKLNRIPGDGISAFGEMNTALFKDIAVIHVDSSVREFETIHVLNVSTGKHTFSHPRLLLIAEKQAKVRILEDYVGIGGFGYMTNSVSEISLAAGAQVIHVKLQRDDDSAYHIAHTHVGVDNGASYRNWSISVGAAVSRHNLVTRQRQEGGDIQIKGLALGHEKRIVDTHSCIEHTEPHGESNQVHKTIAGGRSKVVFNGKVKVHRNAQQTNSSQQNRNLLLSARASVDAKPELEIFADDVKCAHGATVGQVSEDELFYLKTRGLDDVMARNVLNYAFAKEVIDDLPIASLAGVIESYIKEQTKT